jgi:hypothetical protein
MWIWIRIHNTGFLTYKKNLKKFSYFLVIKTLNPDWIRMHLECWIRIRIQLIQIHNSDLIVCFFIANHEFLTISH